MKQPLLLAFAAVLLVGCAPTLSPHTPYLPLLRTKGEAEAKVSSGLTGRQLELQLGYQLTNRLVMHTALLSQERPKQGTSFRSIDLGLGYYRTLTNDRWRVGVHAGAAHGRGTSGSDSFCLDICSGGNSAYTVRYTYAYVQPTALLTAGNQTWGLGLRLGQTYYHQMDERYNDLNATQTQPSFFDHDGHQFTFLQPAFQFTRRLRPWLVLSGVVGAQVPLIKERGLPVLNLVNPIIGQIGIHFLLTKPSAPQP